MLPAPITADRPNQDLDLVVEAGGEHGLQIADVRAPAAGHPAHAQLVGAAVGRAAVDDDGGGLVLVDAIPEVIGVVAVAEHGVGGEDGELPLCGGSVVVYERRHGGRRCE